MLQCISEDSARVQLKLWRQMLPLCQILIFFCIVTHFFSPILNTPVLIEAYVLCWHTEGDSTHQRCIMCRDCLPKKKQHQSFQQMPRNDVFFLRSSDKELWPSGAREEVVRCRFRATKGGRLRWTDGSTNCRTSTWEITIIPRNQVFITVIMALKVPQQRHFNTSHDLSLNLNK